MKRYHQLEFGALHQREGKTDFLCLGCPPQPSLHHLLAREERLPSKIPHRERERWPMALEGSTSSFYDETSLPSSTVEKSSQPRKRLLGGSGAQNRISVEHTILSLDGKRGLASAGGFGISTLERDEEWEEVYRDTSMKSGDYTRTIQTDSSSEGDEKIDSVRKNTSLSLPPAKKQATASLSTSQIQRRFEKSLQKSPKVTSPPSLASLRYTHDAFQPIVGFLLATHAEEPSQWFDAPIVPHWFTGKFFQTEEDFMPQTKEMQALSTHFKVLKEKGIFHLDSDKRSRLLGEGMTSTSIGSTSAVLENKQRVEETNSKSLSSTRMGKISSDGPSFLLSNLFQGRNWVRGSTQDLEGDRAFSKPFSSDLVKQQRYETFLKLKEDGKHPEAILAMESDDRHHGSAVMIREREEFERVYTLFKKKEEEDPISISLETSAGNQKAATRVSEVDIPTKTEWNWQPTKLLCRRWTLFDPWSRKVFSVSGPSSMEALPIHIRSEEDSMHRIQKMENRHAHSSSVPTSGIQKDISNPLPTNKGLDISSEEWATEKVAERPSLGLFKAIFEVDSDEETQTD
ncbi:hypothetical protein IE077_002131 [Cardiosporidium cionae]|uniref:Uncharacterized protein n=1 Tax=Cardiosporidium cionae TaxID=476202 RepID=A0ABQ7JBH6_9APIC|nr:hypothetical protein IE077_002131 [Cardiosporidium cionae]|eukprot:KAF8821353.1 hypothetical protein IE077_002131 [Cardiosporidium cionae]